MCFRSRRFFLKTPEASFRADVLLKRILSRGFGIQTAAHLTGAIFAAEQRRRHESCSLTIMRGTAKRGYSKTQLEVFEYPRSVGLCGWNLLFCAMKNEKQKQKAEAGNSVWFASEKAGCRPILLRIRWTRNEFQLILRSFKHSFLTAHMIPKCSVILKMCTEGFICKWSIFNAPNT